MKKFDFVHTTILIVAILLGYSGLGTLLSLLNLVFYLSDISVARIDNPTWSILFTSAIYVVAAILLVRNGKRIAAYLLRSDNAVEAGDEGSGDDQPEAPADLGWDLDRNTLIFVLLIGLGLYTLMLHLPKALTDSFNTFRNTVNTDAFPVPAPRDALALDLLHIVIGCFLVFGAAGLTNFIDKTIGVRLRKASQPE